MKYTPTNQYHKRFKTKQKYFFNHSKYLFDICIYFILFFIYVGMESFAYAKIEF